MTCHKRLLFHDHTASRPTNDGITQQEPSICSLIRPLNVQYHAYGSFAFLCLLCVTLLWSSSTHLMLKTLKRSLSIIPWPKLSWTRPSGFGSYPPKCLHKVHVLLLAQWQPGQFHTAAQHPEQSPTSISPASKYKTSIIFKKGNASFTLSF